MDLNQTGFSVNEKQMKKIIRDKVIKQTSKSKNDELFQYKASNAIVNDAQKSDQI